MDIESFKSELVARLTRAGADGAAARAETQAFISALPPEEAVRLAAAADNEAVMQRITDPLMRRVPKRAPAPETTDDGGFGDDGIDDVDDIDEMLASSSPERMPERQPQPRHAQPQVHKREARPVKQPIQQPVQQPQIQRPQPIQQPQQMPQQMQQPQQMQPQPIQQPQPMPQTVQQAQPVPRPAAPVRAKQAAQAEHARPVQKSDETQKDRRVIYKPDPNADYRKFYIILACTSPLWGFAALLAAAAFLFVVGALSASIVVIIAGIFVGVAVGTTLALIGIIYGITQLFEYSPIGMYEIGLGIMIGGIVMFLGVLAYNIAVRLVPYLLKKLMVFLSFAIHKCIELYYYVKGRCADL